MYLNQEWQPKHEGCLRIWPPQKSEDSRTREVAGSGQRADARGCNLSWGADAGGAAVLEVAPVGGRIVVFLSGAVDHEVLLTRTERFAITAWCQ